MTSKVKVGKAYHFKGQVHDTVFVVVSEVEGKPWMRNVLILQSETQDGHFLMYEAGSTAFLHIDSMMALEAVPL